MITMERILAGLDLLVLCLANDRAADLSAPPGWEPHEWAYICGIASHAVLRLRDNLARDTGHADLP